GELALAPLLASLLRERLAPLRDIDCVVPVPLAARRLRERGYNQAVEIARPLGGASIAVVDDVMTTGSTLDELAATLKQAGAARVVNWVVARTAPAS